MKFEVQELSKGFVVDYFDMNQPTEMDSENIYLETIEDVLRYLNDKVEATLKWRREEAKAK